MASPSNSSDAPRRNEVEASQGSKSPGLIYVLVGGLVLVLVAFAVVWAIQGR